MRRALTLSAARSPSSAYIRRLPHGHISNPARRHFSIISTRFREHQKGISKPKPGSLKKRDEDNYTPRFLQPHATVPKVVQPKQERPWSTALLKERLGAVFKCSEEWEESARGWNKEASELRKRDPALFKKLFSEYVESIRVAVGLQGKAKADTPPKILEYMQDVANFERMYQRGGQKALDVVLMDTFIMKKHDASHCVRAQRNLADFAHPAEWFPKTRTLKRTWHLHVGPTNSGKTYNALKRLEESKNGIFCGPLRLLAHEVYTRLNAKGVPCNLITGEERRINDEDVNLFAATVEMAMVDTPFDVAVIDEIQMLSDPERGWAWTNAVLGLMAKEIHLCGEIRAIGIVEKLAKLCGEELIIHRYERLGKLEVLDHSLNGDFSKIERGDCVVGFARKDIHAIKRFIEQITGLKCAVVYGSLPAETRALQAKYFNDPESDYDVLVASDAVGLGLNLSIKRVVFSTMYKFNGESNIVIPVPLTRQIAGRAGRYRSAADDSKKQANPTKADETFPTQASPENITTLGPPADGKTGYVTTFLARDLSILRTNMATEPPQIEQAFITPRNTVLENYCALFPSDTPFHRILERIASQASVSSLFTLSNIKPMIEVATLLQAVEGLSDMEKINLSLAPVKTKIESVVTAFIAFARAIALGRQSTLLDFPKKVIDIEALEIDEKQKAMGMRRLEELHMVIMLYAWVSQRFRHTLTGDDITQELKALVEAKIDEGMRSEKDSNVVLSKKFREDAKRGKSINLETLEKGANIQMHPKLTAAKRLRPSDRAAAAANLS